MICKKKIIIHYKAPTDSFGLFLILKVNPGFFLSPPYVYVTIVPWARRQQRGATKAGRLITTNKNDFF